VLRGNAGAGKSALLDYVGQCAVGCTVARVAGVESEMELAFAGLHQLSAPMLDRLDRLPAPQRDALATVFGLSAGPAPDRFLISLATLTLFAEVAEHQPLVLLVDDAQWLDHASAQILAFVARRFLAERVALVAAARTGTADQALAGLPQLLIGGLDDHDARALLLENIDGPLDVAICDQIVAESHGNPLALLELPRTWNTAEVAGGFGVVGSQPVAGRIEQSYAGRLRALPPDTQLLVLTAAAEPLGDALLLHRAAATLDLDMARANPAVDAGLLGLADRVEFAHPLVRSAAYRQAAADDRQRVHHALADATDPATDPDRRAWHRAHASVAPNEEVADELERSAARAQARGGLAAAAAFLEKAAVLTPEPALRARRMLAAANASRLAGMPGEALALLTSAERGPLEELEVAMALRLRGQIDLDHSRGGEAVPVLLEAARRLEPFDPALARETHLDALSAATVAGRFSEGMVAAAGRAARSAPPAGDPPDATDILLDGLAVQLTEGFARGAPILKRALTAFRDEDESGRQDARWQWMASRAAVALFDDEMWELLASRYVRGARDVGALGVLPITLNHLAAVRIHQGELNEAAALLDEADRIALASGGPRMLVSRSFLAACRGEEGEFLAVHRDLEREATSRGDEASLAAGSWARAVYHNGRGEYEAALEAAWQTRDLDEFGIAAWPLPELIEGAVRCGRREDAIDAFALLSERATATGTDLALGFEAAARGLLGESGEAEAAYGEAIERLDRTRMRVDAARARLLYGEWLRREGRRSDARQELRSAHDVLIAAGVGGFAERARRELIAIGDKVRRRTAEARDELTPQEEQIALLARDGLSNLEIAAQLFISGRTVEWHLRKVFAKLGISSRTGLRGALPRAEAGAVPTGR
jgi:DNA-binding CsgD family transcriptional regulator